ncbi:MAG: Fic family protein [Myxococcales bacterium]|jgi:Fic family protein|nr:Fic family protein [Myxococcales bacterium]
MKTRYQEIEDRSAALQRWIDPNRAQAQDFRTKFEMSYIYHENALDGIVVTGPELVTALSTMDEATDSSLVPVYREIRTHKQAFDFVQAASADPKTHISLELITHLHNLLCPLPLDEDGNEVPPPETPRYRLEQPAHRSYFHEIAKPEDIPEKMESFLDEMFCSDFKELHTIDQACTLHWTMMQIFPFAEKSGKLVRLLANLLLMKKGHLPVIIHAVDRQRYYDALRGSEESLRMLTVDAMVNSLDNALQYFRGSRPVPQTSHRHR